MYRCTDVPMDRNKNQLKSINRKKTALDKAYYKHLNSLLDTIDEEKEARWETYNLIIQELINQGKGDYFKEIKYKLTDGEDPNKVILAIIEREVDEPDNLIWILKKRIEEYLEEDNIKRFY